MRPFNKREKNTERVTQVEDKTICLRKGDKSNNFAYDFLYDSENTTQDQVYDDLGREMLQNAFQGYNICIFAYGQTGSGKSYTMMGDPKKEATRGIIPRLCDDLFTKAHELMQPPEPQDGDPSQPIEIVQYRMEVSYLEIYCERVRDLLKPSSKNLRVREHPKVGPYVDGLSKCVVKNFSDIERLMDEGNKSRTVASTNMNSESSRSHGVFRIILTERRGKLEKVSKISLVDLAGSERASKTGATGGRLREGANINKSLTCLGKVIQALAEKSSNSKKDFVPYRESVLTWLLKENLGGNSKTAMIATVSPSADNFEESLSTLRYADRAKNIKCKAIVNEDPRAKMIRELREEIEQLKKDVQTQPAASQLEPEAVQEVEETKAKLSEAENLIVEMNESWEEKLRKTEEIHQERTRMLVEMGVALNTKGTAIGVFSSKAKPHLVNLNEDPLMSECLLYYLHPEGVTKLGSGDDQDIVLFDPFKNSIREEHCVFTATETDFHPYPRVVLVPIDSQKYALYVNGNAVAEETELTSGDRIVVGSQHCFRFMNPMQAKHSRERAETQSQFSISNESGTTTTGIISDGWNFARLELLKKEGIDLVHDREERALELEEIYLQEKLHADNLLETRRREKEAQAGGKTNNTILDDAQRQCDVSWQLISGLRGKIGAEDMKKLVNEHGLPASSSGNLDVGSAISTTGVSNAPTCNTEREGDDINRSFQEIDDAMREAEKSMASFGSRADSIRESASDITLGPPSSVGFDDSVSRADRKKPPSITGKSEDGSSAMLNNTTWVTVADLKCQTIKEICYTVALNEFKMSKGEIQACTTLKYRDLLKRHGKTDVNLAASLASLVADIFDTFGIDYDPEQYKHGLASKAPAPGTAAPTEQSSDKLQAVNKLEKKVEEMEKKLRLQRQAESWKVLEDRMVNAYSHDGWISPAYVPSVTFDQPSPGIVVPDGLEGEEKIAWLMENDAVFRRGRLAWLKKQETYQKNLQQREINKQKRREQADKQRKLADDRRKQQGPSEPQQRSNQNQGNQQPRNQNNPYQGNQNQGNQNQGNQNQGNQNQGNQNQGNQNQGNQRQYQKQQSNNYQKNNRQNQNRVQRTKSERWVHDRTQDNQGPVNRKPSYPDKKGKNYQNQNNRQNGQGGFQNGRGGRQDYQNDGQSWAGNQQQQVKLKRSKSLSEAKSRSTSVNRNENRSNTVENNNRTQSNEGQDGSKPVNKFQAFRSRQKSVDEGVLGGDGSVNNAGNHGQFQHDKNLNSSSKSNPQNYHQKPPNASFNHNNSQQFKKYNQQNSAPNYYNGSQGNYHQHNNQHYNNNNRNGNFQQRNKSGHLYIPPAKRGSGNNNQKTPRTPKNKNPNQQNQNNGFFDQREKSNVSAKGGYQRRSGNNNNQNRPKSAHTDIRQPPSFVMNGDSTKPGGKKQWRKDMPQPTEVKGVIPSSSSSAVGNGSKAAVSASIISTNSHQ